MLYLEILVLVVELMVLELVLVEGLVQANVFHLL